MTATAAASQGTRGARVLDRIERVGNALPHPATLFVLLSLAVVVLSAVLSAAGVSAIGPDGAAVRPVNLLSADGLRRLMLGVVPNFTGFAPLGPVLVALLGFAVAERSGLLAAVLRVLLERVPARALTTVVVFAGATSHTAGDVGYVVLIPLGAALFHAAGRHPVAGIAAAFAGVSGGFAANLLLSPTDLTLAGLTQEAARLVDPAYEVTPLANYYFLATSVVLITVIGTVVTDRVTSRRLGAYGGPAAPAKVERLADVERRGLRWAAVALAVVVALAVAGYAPADGILRDPERPGFVGSYLVRGLVFVLVLAGGVPGLAYGIATGVIRRDHDVYRMMQDAIAGIAGYLVLVFFVAQFVALFTWSNLGALLAVNGAALVRAAALPPPLLLVGIVLLTLTVDLLVGSASAKWAILAPVFVPALMLAGTPPEVTQAAYRVGDSITNIISPFATNFALVLTFVQRYQPSAGIGTTTSLMVPYSLANLIAWTAFLLLWTALGIPVGPG